VSTEPGSGGGAGGPAFPTGYLAANPLPTGILGALGIGGYQLLADVAGVGAGRLGSHVFLLVAPDPDPNLPQAGVQISLHQAKLRDESEVSAFTQLAATLGYLRLSGYRLILERSGIRSKINLLNPATGGVAMVIPDKHPGRLLGGTNVQRLLAQAKSLPQAGLPPDTSNPELLRQVLLALALRDDTVSGEQAVTLADRALALSQADSSLDPAGALRAAKEQGQLGA
jgi:hypothetical protein